jgi:hypothetical protein
LTAGNPWAAYTYAGAAGQGETFWRIKGEASDGEARGSVGRQGLESATDRLYTKATEFAIFHHYQQLFAGSGVFAHHVAAFFYGALTIYAIEFDVSCCLWFYVHLNFDGAGRSLRGGGGGVTQKESESEKHNRGEIFEDVHGTVF